MTDELLAQVLKAMDRSQWVSLKGLTREERRKLLFR